MPSIKERSLRCSLVQGDDNEHVDDHVDDHVEDHVDCDVDQKHSSLMTDSVDENKQREGCGSMTAVSTSSRNTSSSHQQKDDGVFVGVSTSRTTNKQNFPTCVKKRHDDRLDKTIEKEMARLTTIRSSISTAVKNAMMID